MFDRPLKALQAGWHLVTGKAQAQAKAELRIRYELHKWVLPEFTKTIQAGKLSEKCQQLFEAALLRKPRETLAILESPRVHRRKTMELLKIVLTDQEFYQYRQRAERSYWEHVARVYDLSERISPTCLPVRAVSERPPTLQEMMVPKPGEAQRNICKAAADWILPELARQLEGLTRAEMIALVCYWQEMADATQAILASRRSRQDKLTELVVLALERWYDQQGFGTEYWSLAERIVDGFAIQARLSGWRKCEHCGVSKPDKLMKNLSRCWDCWGG